jgi:hypothetical protein
MDDEKRAVLQTLAEEFASHAWPAGAAGERLFRKKGRPFWMK